MATEALRARAPSKRAKLAKAGASNAAAGGVYPFHPEDVTIAKVRATLLVNSECADSLQYATHTVEWPVDTGPRDADAFGLDVRARMMLVPADRVADMVKEMREVYVS